MTNRMRTPRFRWQRLFRDLRWWSWWGLALLSMLLCALIPTWATAQIPAPATPITQSKPGTPEKTGQTLYDAGRFNEAAIVLEQAVQQLRSQNDPLGLAATLANLSLTYQQLGQFEPASQAITESLQLLAKPLTQTAWQIRAQALEVQGRLLLTTGDGEKAIAAWEQAETSYRQSRDEAGIVQAQLNQAQALRSQGFARRALDLLTQLNQRLQSQPDSRQKVIALRSLGDTLQLIGDLRQAENTLEQSLEIAQQLQLSSEASSTLLSLGNLARAQKQAEAAIAYYQQAASTAVMPLSRVQAQLNQLNLLIEAQQWVSVQALLPQIPSNLEAVPPSRAGVYARINFAQALLRLGSSVESDRQPDQASSPGTPHLNAPSPFAVIPYPQSLSQLLRETLRTAIQQAKQLNDPRAESYAMGTLGAVYEQTGQIKEAQEVTQKALVLAQSSNTWDVAYRWQWQLGRLQRQAGNVPAAIAAYDAAIANLKSLRGDLAAVNSDVQFNFRDSVEPIYRQSVELLLQSEGGNPQEKTLEKVRDHIEALQLAELDNFFQEACLEGKRVLLDDVVDKDNPTTSIVYPIVQRDRAAKTVTIQVIAKIPNQPLKRYVVAPMPEVEFDRTVQRLQELIPASFNANNRTALHTEAQKLYTWLIAPLEQEIQTLAATKALTNQKVDTLVFVLDDALRNVPMAALWDGQQYLVEKYGIALSLGLQLFDPKPLNREPLRVLAAGLSTPPPGSSQEFGVLPAVQSEIEAIARLGVTTTPLLDQAFTRSTLGAKINADPFNVVHLATHGKFSSRAEETFILAADGPINVTQFDTLLRSRDITRPEAIQLLVLSACQTATNDNRATLGLAGFAVRAGARSTLASLRNVNDESTSLLIEEFYRQLNNTKEPITKAEALRRSQVALLNSPNYRSPQYWAPYVLIGNWL